MTPFDSFQPPTDSVYKFMALTGVVLLLAFIALFWRVYQQFSEKLVAAKIRGRVLQKKIELIQSFQDKVKVGDSDIIKTRDELIELACAQEEHDVLTNEAEEYGGRLKTVSIAFPFLLVGSAVLAIQGFSLWYSRVQVFQDRLLVLEAQEKEPKKPNQTSEPTAPSGRGSP